MPRPNRNVPKTVRLNLLDETFGEWTVLGYAGHDSSRNILWLCRCSCGKTKEVIAGNLSSGRSTMCFDCGYVKGRKGKYAPGVMNSAIYWWWRVARREGACKAWQDFAAFARDTSPKPPQAGLARKSEHKPHSPRNSYWHTPQHTIQRQIDELVSHSRPATKAAEARLREHLAGCTPQYRCELLKKARRGEPIFRRKSLVERFAVKV